jgi:hypothetical protein
MLVADKHHTVRPVFCRLASKKGAVHRVYEGNDNSGIFDKDYRLTNTLEFNKHSSVEDIAARFDAVLQHPNKTSTFCVRFWRGSHRKLIDSEDLFKTPGTYSVSRAGQAFARIAHRIQRLEIFYTNHNLAPVPGSDQFIRRFRDVFLEVQNACINANNDTIEFISRHCRDTLTELAIPSFDCHLEWKFITHEDEIRRCGRLIARFQQLKSLKISSFSCDHNCFAVFLDSIEQHTKKLEAIDLSGNIIDRKCSETIRKMLIDGNLLRLDINHIRVHNDSSFKIIDVPLFIIVDGCCNSRTIGVVKMRHARGTSMEEIYDLVIASFKNGNLKLFEFCFGKTELCDTQQRTILECRARNFERWTLARRLQANEVAINEMYDVISRISWDKTVLKDAMKHNASDMLLFVAYNKSAQRAMKHCPKRKTRTSLKAWRDNCNSSSK